MSRQSRRHRAVEGVDPELDARDQIVDLADPEQMARTLRRQPLELCGHPPNHLVHLWLVAPERAADRDPRRATGDDGLGGLGAQVPLDAPLDDAIETLVRRSVTPMEALAALEPAMGALH